MRSLFRFVWVGFLTLASTAAAAFDYPMKAEEVAPGVYAVITPTRDLPNPENGGWNSNMAFIETGHGVLLFDTGSSQDIGKKLKAVIASVTDQPVRWIINSHGHGDHWLGNAAFSETVASIYASAPVTSLIQTDGSRWVEMFDGMTRGVTGQSTILAPDTLIKEDQVVIIGGLKIEFLLSGGGHSPSDLMIWLPDSSVLIAGDVIYSDRMPSTNAGDLANWLKVLPRLEALQPRVVIPGHGAVTDARGITRLNDLLTTLWRSVETGIEQGLSDFEMLPMVYESLSSFEPYYPGLEEKLRRDLSHVYLQVEAATF